MLQLHDDKTRELDFKTRYVAKSLYHILNDANASFLG